MEDFKLSLEQVNYINSLFDEPIFIIENNKARLATEDAQQRLREKAEEVEYGK